MRQNKEFDLKIIRDEKLPLNAARMYALEYIIVADLHFEGIVSIGRRDSYGLKKIIQHRMLRYLCRECNVPKDEQEKRIESLKNDNSNLEREIELLKSVIEQQDKDYKVLLDVCSRKAGDE